MDYVSNAELIPLVRKWKRSKVMPDELVEAVTNITKGILKRYCKGFEVEEAVQYALTHVLELRKWFDVKKNLFNSLTTVILNELRQKMRSGRRWLSAVVWREGCENGRPVPVSGTEKGRDQMEGKTWNSDTDMCGD